MFRSTKEDEKLNKMLKLELVSHTMAAINPNRRQTGESCCCWSNNPIVQEKALHLGTRLRGINKGGKFLKKLWCCVSGSITR